MRLAVLIALLVGCEGSPEFAASEQVRIMTMRAVWITTARGERCPRPALRTPVTGDGSKWLAGMLDAKSPVGSCLDRVWALHDELVPCKMGQVCALTPLEALKPHPEILAACAPLYDAIERVTHATEACSPFGFDDVDATPQFAMFIALNDAVRFEIAPLVANGQLGAAAHHVLDAMRFADDLARRGTVIGEMIGVAVATRLAHTLEDLVVDPRLTGADAAAIVRDLGMLEATAPRFDAIARQEAAFGATHIVTDVQQRRDIIPKLLSLEQRMRGVERVCSGTLRDCVEHLGDVKVADDVMLQLMPMYVRRLGARDLALAVVRMQLELRMAGPNNCTDPTRRRQVLARWLAPETAVLGDEPEPIVTAPAWQQFEDQPKELPYVLHCVPTAL